MKIGDTVKIRSWEAMQREYGLNDNGNIELERGAVVKEMKKLCGSTQEISKVIYHGTYNRYSIDDWLWTEDMFEPNFQYGEMIEVRDTIDQPWQERIFVGYIDGAKHPFTCSERGMEYFNKKMNFYTMVWTCARKIKQETAVALSIEGEDFTVKDDLAEIIINLKNALLEREEG